MGLFLQVRVNIEGISILFADLPNRGTKRALWSTSGRWFGFKSATASMARDVVHVGTWKRIEWWRETKSMIMKRNMCAMNSNDFTNMRT